MGVYDTTLGNWVNQDQVNRETFVEAVAGLRP